MTIHDWLLLAPLSCGAVLLALRWNRRTALFAGGTCLALLFLFAVLRGSSGAGIAMHLTGMATGLALVERLKRASKRVTWLHVGLAVTAMQTVTAAAVVTFFATSLQDARTSRIVFLAGASAAASFALASAAAPYVERRLGWVTRSLLADLAQPFGSPLVAKLQSRAPNTFELSRRASEIAAAAGAAVGADTLAIRAGAMHAEVGRLDCARSAGLASAEPSLELSPELECLVEFDHVKDGLAICEDYDLPRPVLNLVAEHHGTLLRRDALEAAQRLRGKDATAFAPQAFRYPGPRPTSRESAAVQAGWFLAEYGVGTTAVEDLESAVEGGEWADSGLSGEGRKQLLEAALRCAKELKGREISSSVQAGAL